MTATLRPLGDVERIRRLLSPERAARRPQPAPSRRSGVVDVDRKPVRIYPPDNPAEHNPADTVAALRLARRTGRVVRHQADGAPVVDVEAELRGMPTEGQRRARTLRALNRLQWGPRDHALIARQRERQRRRAYAGEAAWL